MDLIGFLLGFGALQGLTLGVTLLLTNKGNHSANRLMAALVVVISLHLLSMCLRRANVFVDFFPAGAGLTPALRLTWGPLFYLYVVCIVNRPLTRLQLVHFLPYLVLMLFTMPFFFYSEGTQRTLLTQIIQAKQEYPIPVQATNFTTPFMVYWLNNYLTGTVFSIQFGIYAVVILRTLKQHNQSIKHYYSSLEQISLRWLYILTCVCLLFLIMYLITNRSVVWQTGGIEMADLTPNIPYLFMALVLYSAGFMALSQRRIQLVELPQKNNNEETDVEKKTTHAKQQSQVKSPAAKTGDGTKSKKYEFSTLTEHDAQNYAVKLKHVIEQEQLFLNNELTLPELAQQAEIAPYLVSQVLNETLNTSYFNFVNHYRIELAKELFNTPGKRKMAIVDLAMEVGFKSKSSFYDAFKKSTQMTPTQYKKILAEKQS